MAALAPNLAPAPANAVTSGGRPTLAWTGPGKEACGDICSTQWALGRMRAAMPLQVHAELARRLVADKQMPDYRISSGDVIVALSYVREGAAAVDFTRRVAQLPAGIDVPAAGHSVAYQSRLYRFVRLAGSGDWALIIDEPAGLDPAQRQAHGGRGGLLPSLGGVSLGGGSGGAGGGSGGGSGDPLTLVTTPIDSPQPDPFPPTPIPLPGTIALLAGGLAPLGAARFLRRPSRAPAAG